MDYAGALAHLERFVNFELSPSAEFGEPDWDLDAFRLFLAELGYPERAFPAVLVAGTKGKGSVASLLSAGLAAAGYRVGLYTSPHLASPCERIAIDGAPISEADFAARVSEILPFLEARPGLPVSFRTWFEIVTAAAFLEFRRARVDLAVLEVGLGGRLDATNVVDPLVSVITSISLDHTKTLGDTLAAIAREKAGILRDGGLAVFAPQPREARRVLASEARRRAAVVSEARRGFDWTERRADAFGSVFDYRGGAALDAVRLGLGGFFQMENASVAIRTLELLAERGFPVGESALRGALAAARWPGRFEVIPGEPTILLDGAHNTYSIRVLLDAVARVFPGRPIVCLFAASKDKEWAVMLDSISAAASRIVVTEASTPRAAPAESLLAHVRAAAPERACEISGDPTAALALARAAAAPGELVLVTGSLYLVGAVREVLRGEGAIGAIGAAGAAGALGAANAEAREIAAPGGESLSAPRGAVVDSSRR